MSISRGSVQRLTSDKDAPEAIRIAREGKLDQYQRTWAYTQASRVLAKSDKVRSTELLIDALAEARRIGDGEPSDDVEENRAAPSLLSLPDLLSWIKPERGS